MSREAMQIALEALEANLGNWAAKTKAISVLRQALETEQQPVAHVYLFDKAGRPLVAWDNAKDIKLGDKLYAAPKQWVGLTDEEHDNIKHNYHNMTWTLEMFGRAIEAKLKEKNG
jgi:hypothetical protein